MNSKTVSILLSIALLAGLNIAVPAVIAVGEPDGPDEVVSDDVDDVDNEALAASQDQSAANSAAATSGNLGTIYVGPSASGESVRILSTAYTLPPLRSACLTCFGVGIIIGPGDLSTPWIVDRLRVAYEAGHAVGLTNATVAGIERFRDLLGHRRFGRAGGKRHAGRLGRLSQSAPAGRRAQLQLSRFAASLSRGTRIVQAAEE